MPKKNVLIFAPQQLEFTTFAHLINRSVNMDGQYFGSLLL